MEYTTYASRLRYLDAGDVDDAVVDYDGLDVRGPADDKLGTVDGFIVDAQAGRVFYVVVDSGGWFRSRRFLLPIGHATVDPVRRALQVDVSRDALSRYPDFNEDRFRQFSDEDLRSFEKWLADACCPGEPLDDVSVPAAAYETRRHYGQPAWWKDRSYASEQLRPVDLRPPKDRERARDVHNRDLVTSRDDSTSTGAPGRDVSPHHDSRLREDVRSEAGRAQPGDVLGIDTAGARTSMGDTTDDEHRRRRAAERAVADDEPRQSER